MIFIKKGSPNIESLVDIIEVMPISFWRNAC